MSIVVNGTTIPENVANALNVNGTNITSVVCNGVTVWTQSLFNATWSGSSISSSIVFGIEASGSSWRCKYGTLYGAWSSVTLSGTFTANSFYYVPYGYGIEVSGNLMKVGEQFDGAWVTFTLSTKQFTGNSDGYSIDSESGQYSHELLTTSGGLIRGGAQAWGSAYYYGQYISLT